MTTCPLSRARSTAAARRLTAQGRRTPGCRGSRPRFACASNSSSEPSGSSSTSPWASTSFVLSFAACTSGWSNGLMPMIEPATATANSQRKNSWPSSYGLGSATSSCSSARGSSGAGTMPLPCLPVDSATSCSIQRPNESASELRPDAGRRAETQPELQPGVASGEPTRLLHLDRALEQPRRVDAHQHRRHDPERRQRRVAAADRRLAVEDAQEAVLVREALEVGARIRDRRELPAALEEVRRVRARLQRRSRLRSGEEERALGVDLRLERADRLRVRRVEDVEALGARTSAAAPPARATSRPCRARRRRRSLPPRRRRSRRPGRRRAARASAAARRASRATAPRRRRSRRSGRGPRSARRARWQRPAQTAASASRFASIPCFRSVKESTNFCTPSRSSVSDTSS